MGCPFWATLLPHAYFKSGIIDPMFNYFILLSVFALLRAMHLGLQGIWKAGWWLAAGTASGWAVLTKGPVGFLLLALTALFGFFVTNPGPSCGGEVQESLGSVFWYRFFRGLPWSGGFGDRVNCSCFGLT